MPYYRAGPPAAAPAPERIGVLLVNLGTPDAPTYFAVQRYLAEFLGDRRVIDTSRLFWMPILYGFVLPFRPFRTVRNYRKIWMKEGSPLGVYSQRLTSRVESLLTGTLGDRVRVALGMTYGNPSIESALAALADQDVGHLLVLPLFPQYSCSTTAAAFDRTTAVLQRYRFLPETRFINDYHEDPGYIEALAHRVLEHWREQGERSHLILSYHGIPESYVKDGDPYQRQAEATTRAVAARLGLSPEDYSHCYQSRFGSVVWLQPYTSDTLEELARRGLKCLTVLSPSFAVDCLETLQEVALEYRDEFRDLGGERLTLVPGLNDDERHASAIANLIRRHLGGWV
jgi:ferrochelatase